MPPVSAPSRASAGPGGRMAVPGTPPAPRSAACRASSAAAARPGTAVLAGGNGQDGCRLSRSGWSPANARSAVARNRAAMARATSRASGLS